MAKREHDAAMREHERATREHIDRIGLQRGSRTARLEPASGHVLASVRGIYISIYYYEVHIATIINLFKVR